MARSSASPTTPSTAFTGWSHHSKPVRSSAGNDAEGRLPGPRLWFDGRRYLVARGLLYA